MKRFVVLILGGVMLPLLGGCASETRPAGTAPHAPYVPAQHHTAVTTRAASRPAERAPLTKEDAEFRLSAASKISNVNTKSEAFQRVALDAADAGLEDVVKKALDGIANFTTKSDAAGQCALKLARAGKRAAAIAVAESIPQVNQRDATLKKLAEGQE
jgi:hypothetical protein